MCVCSRLAFLYLCVSCVCSTLSPGTSAMPPLSQFLTSLSKNMLIQTNLLFLLLRLSSPPSPPHPQHFSWDGLEETRVHHPQPGCLISFPSFIFISPPPFPLLYFTGPHHPFPRPTSVGDDEETCQLETVEASLLCGPFFFTAPQTWAPRRDDGGINAWWWR